ncbi:MAG: hypothetical protein B7Z55_06600 [Planctomycetales bacterium 12-60-4]|nr:MAG: hypothetical protein B7Z55_06600 [Planctomycetales bacterium 12-60-4]
MRPMNRHDAVDTMYFRVVKVHTAAGGRTLTNATAFFFLHDGFLYLITCKHVVANPAAGHFPDSLHVSLHTSMEDLQHTSSLSIPLYMNGVPQWYQHSGSASTDLAAVAVNDPNVLNNHLVIPFRCDDILSRNTILPLGQDVLILGFPLGFHDTWHNIPIVRRATIASLFSHPFKGEPYFLTDARLHRGMSGSPVIAKVHDDTSSPKTVESEWRLLGIHASALDVSDRDPVQDERLALNTAWYASLIMEILPDHSVGGTASAQAVTSVELREARNIELSSPPPPPSA